jgi:ABC-type oligopeptide transport system substrate-binding subunit
MKRFFIISLVFIAIFANQDLSARARPETDKNTVSYGLATTPDHLDPFQATSADSRVVLFNIFEGLLKPAPVSQNSVALGSLVPAVASGY